MAFKGRSELRASIEDNISYLEALIQEYPSFLKSWTEKTDREFRNVAKDVAEGDAEIFRSIYFYMLFAFDGEKFKQDTFFKAMLIMVYSFYERIVPLLLNISKRPRTNDLIELICKVNNIQLSEKAEKAKEFLYNDVREMRNFLVHNDGSLWVPQNNVKDICERHNGINYDAANKAVCFTEEHFILDALKSTKSLIIELLSKMEEQHNKTTNKSKKP